MANTHTPPLTVVMIRHGQSQWNYLDRFTGWADVRLSPEGVEEAQKLGSLLAKNQYHFDLAFTSVLQRAIKTLHIALMEMRLEYIPIIKDYRLNERHYGALQGQSKVDLVDTMGWEQVHAWRRGFEVKPPALSLYDSRHPSNDMRYNSIHPSVLPVGESLQDTVARVVPFWEEAIKPHVMSGKKIVISAHGNSLRALIMHLEKIPASKITGVEIPTGEPLIYELHPETLKVQTKFYLREGKKGNWISDIFHRI
jgi:2,3-bisphosphoglycerate-dependent phosphoglycerate mutase